MKMNLKNILVVSAVTLSFCVANLGYSAQSRDKQRHTKGALQTAQADIATCLRQTKGCESLTKTSPNRKACFLACKKATKLRKN